MFIEKYLGKAATEITEADIESFVRKNLEEGVTLEYKDIRTFYDAGELSKEISAFANTMGGLLVLGIGKSDAAPHLPGKITWGDPKLSKERLENTIMDNIRPRMEPPTIIPVRNHTDQQIFLIDVRPSASPPHQASDFKYYKRWNFSSVPMRHQEVMSYSQMEDSYEEARNLAKGVFVILSAVTLYFLAWPLLYLFGLSPSPRLSLDWLSTEVTIGYLILVALYSTFWRLTFERIVVGWRKFSSAALPAIWSLVVVGLLIVILGDRNYPPFFRDHVMFHWDTFETWTVISAISITIVFGIQEKALPHYFRQMHEDDPLGKLKINVESPFFNGFANLKALGRNRKVLGVFALLLLVGVLAQPVDNEFSIFTPSVSTRTSPYALNQFEPYAPALYLIAAVGTNNININGTANCILDAYESFNESISILTPWSPDFAVQNVTITNPSNVSRSAPSLGSGISAIQLGSPWTQLGLSNPSKSNLTFSPIDNNASTIIIPLSGAARHSRLSFSIGYFERAAPDITCTQSLSYNKLSNGTAVIRSVFLFQSNENTTIDIKLFRVQNMLRLLADDPLVTNRQQVNMYFANHTTDFAVQHSGYYDEIDPVYGTIPPFQQANFTIIMTGPGVL